MSEPLYHVGQDVAVCTKQLEIVIPQTNVTAAKFFQFSSFKHPVTGKIFVAGAGWRYQVAHEPGVWVAEKSLRPINPDTEYLDTTQDLAAPVDGVSV